MCTSYPRFSIRFRHPAKFNYAKIDSAIRATLRTFSSDPVILPRLWENKRSCSILINRYNHVCVNAINRSSQVSPSIPGVGSTAYNMWPSSSHTFISPLFSLSNSLPNSWRAPEALQREPGIWWGGARRCTAWVAVLNTAGGAYVYKCRDTRVIITNITNK